MIRVALRAMQWSDTGVSKVSDRTFCGFGMIEDIVQGLMLSEHGV